jgi:RecA/RadA recombinase
MSEKKANIAMRLAALLREKIESSLPARIPAALSPRLREVPELLPTGIAEVDALLEGGLPLGSLTEITGPVCSGRITLVASILAEATRQGSSKTPVQRRNLPSLLIRTLPPPNQPPSAARTSAASNAET